MERIDEDRLEAWIEFAILRHLAGQDEEDSRQQLPQPAGSSTPVVVRSDTTEEEKSATAAIPSGKLHGPQDGISLLQNLTQFAFRKGEAENFARTLLKLLLKHLSPSSRGNVTPDLVLIMVKLVITLVIHSRSISLILILIQLGCRRTRIWSSRSVLGRPGLASQVPASDAHRIMDGSEPGRLELSTARIGFVLLSAAVHDGRPLRIASAEFQQR